MFPWANAVAAKRTDAIIVDVYILILFLQKIRRGIFVRERQEKPNIQETSDQHRNERIECRSRNWENTS